jgi:hypothetical protein
LTMRGFSDLAGLGWQGYWPLLAMAVLAWHEGRGRRGDVRRVVGAIIPGPDWYRRRVVRRVVGFFHSLGYLDFACVDRWRSYGWRECPRSWKVTERGYDWLRGKLANLGLVLEDVLRQTDPLGVKNLIDGRIKAIYKEHWERVRRYEEVVGSSVR